MGIFSRTFGKNRELESIMSQLSLPVQPGARTRRIELCRRGLALLRREQDPSLWATLQSDLGSNLMEDSFGNRAENVEQAIEAFRNALQVRTCRTAPVDWARTTYNLAFAYYERIFGDRADNIERAIELYEQCLSVRTRQAMPTEWAKTIMNLGIAYRNRIRDVKADNIERAIELYQQALQVQTHATMPELWSQTVYNLGIAFFERTCGNREDNIEHAIEYYQQSLQVRIRRTMPVKWADTMNNLAVAYANRIRGDREDNLEQAIKCSRQALEVRTRNTMPLQWAETTDNLGLVYSERISGNPVENIENAIQYCRQALQIRTRETLPVLWAKTTNNLASAYLRRAQGGLAENIECAIDCYQQALQVLRRETMPVEWAQTMNNLAVAYANRIQGDPVENIELAIETCNQALQVRTREAMPFEWAETMNNLAAINLKRTLGGRDENIEQTVKTPQQALEIQAPPITSNIEDCVLARLQVETRALSQAKELSSTIDQEASRFINHHIRQDIGSVGGRIDFGLKVDMLVKTYSPELAASIFLCFPEEAKDRTVDLLRSMDIHWSPFPVEGQTVVHTGSAERAAETMVCILSIMDPSEAARIVGNLTPGTRDMVKAARERIQRAYETQIEKPSVSPVEASMVFIAAGEFIMGTSSEQAKLIVKKLGNWQPSWFDREMPQRMVYLDAYWIDKYPVTNAAYKEFTDATGHPVPWRSAPLARPYNWDRNTGSYPQGKADHPVVLLDWYDACAYAKWAGKRLPTEAEWEKAARGTDGRIWPWGNEWDPTLCNNGMGLSRGTTPVTAFEKATSPYGVVDMSGNVWEWTADGFDMAYHRNSSKSNPRGSGTNKVIRGGCFYDEMPELYRCAVRDSVGPDVWEMYRGFRCVKDA